MAARRWGSLSSVAVALLGGNYCLGFVYVMRGGGGGSGGCLSPLRPSVPPNQPSRDFFNILQVRLRSSHGTTYGTIPQGSEHESCICDLKPAATTHLPQFLRRHPALQIVPSQSVLPCLVRASRRRSRASSPRGYMRHKTASSLLRLAVPPAPRPS